MAEIKHQPEDNRFVLNLDSQDAQLKYRFSDDQRIDFTSTYVPPEFRGKGYARQLVDEGLAWARSQGYHIEASCSYVATVLKRGG